MAAILLNRNRQVPAEETPAFGGIAERFRRAGDLDRAIALCHDGLKRFPDQLSARVTLGWALLDSGQYEAARVELAKVLRHAPDNLAAIRGMAELHDRNDGQALSEEERESWRTEQAAAAEREREQQVAVLAAAPGPEPGADLFAPIPVSFGDADRETPLEVMNTADQAQCEAERAAAGPAAYSFEVAAIVAPSEIAEPDTRGATPTLDDETVFLALETVDGQLDAQILGGVASKDQAVVFDPDLAPDLDPELDPDVASSFDFSNGHFGHRDDGSEMALSESAYSLASVHSLEVEWVSPRVAALERFLHKVRTRRVALQSESVA